MIATGAARADYPSDSVRTAAVGQGQSYPGVDANSEGWFDVGGFCKVVDVGDLSTVAPGAHGVPVFIPGPTQQWENYRTSAAPRYNGALTLTTCCRPQINLGNLCTEAGATVVAVDRQYGKVGEVDTVSATCVDQWGVTYTDSMNVACEVSGGGSDGPDAQATWAETTADATSNCIPNAHITQGNCSAGCGGGHFYETVQDSCGNVTSQGYFGAACNTQSCAPTVPPPPPPVITGIWNVTAVTIGACRGASNGGAGGIPAGDDPNGQTCPSIGASKSVSYSQSGTDPSCLPPQNYDAVRNDYQCQSDREYTWTANSAGMSLSCTDADISNTVLEGVVCTTPGKLYTEFNSVKNGGGCPFYETAFTFLYCE